MQNLKYDEKEKKLESTFPAVSDNDIQKYFENNTELQQKNPIDKLELNYCYSLSDNIFELLQNFYVLQNLQRLSLMGLFNLTDKFLDNLSKSNIKLIYLNVASCQGILDQAFGRFLLSDVAVYIKKLVVQSTQFGDISMSIIKKSQILSLTLLNINDCAKISSKGFYRLFQSNLFQNHLTFLDMSDNKIDDQAFLYLVRDWKTKQVQPSNLTTLKFHGCNLIQRSSTIEQFFQLGIFANLEYLDIQVCNWNNDQVILTIGQNCPKLKHINLSFCDFISVEGVLEFLKQNTCVQELCLQGNLIGNKLVAYFLEKQNLVSNLNFLDLRGCGIFLNRDYYKECLKYFPNLKIIF